MNVLYLHSHDTGRYIEPYGQAIPTPNLMRLAKEGVLFRQAFSAAPTCSPSRAALLTGQSPHESGMLGLAHRGFRLIDPSRHLAHVLRGHGFETVLAGVQHLSPKEGVSACGYTVVRPSGAAPESFAAEYLARTKAPFFLDVGFFETHRIGRGFKDEDVDRTEEAGYVSVPPVLPDIADTRRDVADFRAAAMRLDAKVGFVLEALSRAGLEDDTLVFYTTDHGIAFPRMKCNLTDHGIGVALVLKVPGIHGPVKVVDAMVSHIDLMPTLLAALGLPTPDWAEGMSLMPLLRGERQTVREELFAEVTFHAAYEPKRAVRTRRYKYIRNWSANGVPVLPNIDDGPSKDILLESGWLNRPIEAEELYDLVWDPTESCNRATDPAMSAILADMRGRLDDWMIRTHDPLLTGALNVPDGVVVNDPSGLSPNDPTVPW